MQTINYYGNPWIGMFIKANDKVAFVPIDTMDKVIPTIEEKLKVNVHKISVGDSNLLGIYIAMNSNGIVVPNITTDEEIKKIQTSGLNVYRTDEKHNANGNNIAVNDKGGIINEHISEIERKKIEDVFGVELVSMKICAHTTVGSACLTTNKGFIVHYKTSDAEMKAIESALKVSGKKGTVNTGVGFISTGAIANTKGYIAGDGTTAYEMGRIEESLGFI